MNNLNLDDFIQGHRAVTVNQEEGGFRVNGNIGSLLNSNQNALKNIYEGILYPGAGITNHKENIIGRINAMKNDWKQLKETSPDTPLLYCNNQHNSVLQSLYPNGIQNKVLSPDCNMMLGNSASPTLYGETTAFINDPNVLNNPHNLIGHELQAYGIANQFGMRALSQGKHACQPLVNGNNVPTLKIVPNGNNSYYANPISVDSNIPLYQVGDWTENKPNFLSEFNNNVGEGCKA